MSSNMQILKVCEYCKKDFIAKKTTCASCSDNCAKRLYKDRKRDEKIKLTKVETKSKKILSIAILEDEFKIINAKQFLTLTEAALLLNVSSYLNPTGPNTDYGLPCAISKFPSGGLAIIEVNSNAITKFVAPNNVNIIAGGNQSGLINGVGTAASFYRPIDFAVDVVGNIYIAHAENLCIREITPGGVVTTFAGTPNRGYEDGIGTNVKFNRPFGIDIDANGFLYVTDYLNNRIRKISPAGLVTTIGGTGSFGSNDGNALMEAQFNRPLAICVGSNGIIYIS